ncbi:MAG TPA: ABC transporter permease [Firmicutes bacterium]|jgi:multiple sugar transport system permease protein|nr:ABC transporter permease [Bacillota bacterium]
MIDTVKKSKGLAVTQYISAIVVAFCTLAPFIWLFISSISYRKDLTTVPLAIIPKEVTYQRYLDIFINPNNDMAYTFKVAMSNSLIVVFFVTIISLVVGSLASYAFARLKFIFKNQLMYLILFTYMLPPVVIVIPLYLYLNSLQLLDTKTSLILLYLSMAIPFVIWVMQSYFGSIAKSFEDSAAIDGCNRLQTLWYIFLPIARPGIIATGILSFLVAWDEFFYAVIFTSTLNAKTISVAIAEFSGKNTIDYGMIATGGILASLPALLITFIFQKYIVQGMTAGGVKE